MPVTYRFDEQTSAVVANGRWHSPDADLASLLNARALNLHGFSDMSLAEDAASRYGGEVTTVQPPPPKFVETEPEAYISVETP